MLDRSTRALDEFAVLALYRMEGLDEAVSARVLRSSISPAIGL
jgi:hypothetical protein